MVWAKHIRLPSSQPSNPRPLWYSKFTRDLFLSTVFAIQSHITISGRLFLYSHFLICSVLEKRREMSISELANNKISLIFSLNFILNLVHICYSQAGLRELLYVFSSVILHMWQGPTNPLRTTCAKVSEFFHHYYYLLLILIYSLCLAVN